MGYYCLAVDLSCHGRSTHRKGNISHGNWVQELYEIVNLVKWDKFTVIAHSMGADISILLAGMIPDRIVKLVLIDSLGSGNSNIQVINIIFFHFLLFSFLLFLLFLLFLFFIIFIFYFFLKK